MLAIESWAVARGSPAFVRQVGIDPLAWAECCPADAAADKRLPPTLWLAGAHAGSAEDIAYRLGVGLPRATIECRGDSRLDDGGRSAGGASILLAGDRVLFGPP
jgi:hypothetical protein